MMVPVGATAVGEAIAARPYQICGCPEAVGVARWVPAFDRADPAAYVYWAIDECLYCGASWVSMPPFGEEP